MKRLKLTKHLTVDELEQRYRQAVDPVARSHWQILWLLSQQRPTGDHFKVGAALLYSFPV